MSFKTWLRRAALVTLAIGLSASVSQAAVITLQNQNSKAVFHTQASDGGTLGLNTWEVDGTDHMAEQWFSYRVGSQTREYAIDGTGPLAHFNTTPLDVADDPAYDLVIAEYRDTETTVTPERFSVRIQYYLTGGTTNSNTSDLSEVILIRNLDTLRPLDMNLFQYVDFDLNNNAGDDTLVLSGTPINTATQSDPINIIGETVVTPSPQRWEANFWPTIINNLQDGDIDNLSNSVGPLTGDATWAFQWDFSGGFQIPKNGSVIISKSKHMVPGEGGIVPEPSSIVLAGFGFLGLAVWSRRRRSA